MGALTFHAPLNNAAAVTPSDVADLPTPAKALYIGGAGNVTVDMDSSGNSITFTGVPVGTVLEIGVVRVEATGTTATNIVALW